MTQEKVQKNIITTFKEAGICELLINRLEKQDITTPTPIQAQAIPVAMEGKDVLGTAQTGTGKTAAFGIPLIENLLNNKRGNALILLPTRELAVQVMQSLSKLIGDSKIKSALLIGGEPMPRQISQLRGKPRLIIGTPGRINDHIERGNLKLHDTNFLVLDEVDRMLDMGFGIQLEQIAKYLTAQRQTLMFSATLPKNIEKIAAKYLNDPVRISVGSTSAPAKNVKQENIKISEGEKMGRLIEEIEARDGSIIIFVKTKHGADRMALALYKKNEIKAAALHGDLRQSKRSQVISGFRNKRYKVLVATDIAARGLDIPHIEHVINYDLPQNPEDYIHRIGRTARAGAEGAAVNFISNADGVKWRAIARLLNPDAKHDDFDDRRGGALKKKRSFGGKPGGGFKSGAGKRKPGGNKKFGAKSEAGAKPAGAKPWFKKDKKSA